MRHGPIPYVATLFLMVLGICLPDPARAVMRIKLGVVTQPGSAQNIVAEKFTQLIETRSGQNIRVHIFHSGCLGNETELLQLIQMNSLQMAVVTGGSFDTFAPVTRVINYPFLFKNHDQADQVLDGPLGEEILASLEEIGVKGLGFSENGFRHLTNNRRPVRSPGDLAGLKIRVMASPLHRSIWQAIGAVPVPMPWPIYTELSTRVVDGQENPLWVMDVYRFHEVQKYMTLTCHVYSFHIDVASLKWWQTLGSRDQELIRAAVREAAQYQRHHNRAQNMDRLSYLKNQGMTIEAQPDIQAFRSRVAGVKALEPYADPRVNAMLNKVLDAVK